MKKILILILLCFLSCPAAMVNAAGAPEEAQTVKLVRDALDLFAKQQYLDAEAKCKDALYINPRYFPAYNLLGNIYSLQKGKEKQAVLYFRRSLEIYPNQMTIYTKLSFLYNRIGDFNGSGAILAAGIERYPDDYYMNFNAGMCFLVGMNDPQKALPYLEKAHAINAGDVRLLYLEGVANLFLGKVSSSLELVTAMRQRNEPYLAAHLEDMIRRVGRGEKINPMEVASVFSRRASTKVIDLDSLAEKKRTQNTPVDKGSASMSGQGTSSSVPPVSATPAGTKTKIKLHGKPIDGRVQKVSSEE